MDDQGTVLVTGDAGAIGSATVAAFLGAGYAVLGLDRVSRAAQGRNHVTADVDVTDERATVAALERLDGFPPLLHVVTVAGGAVESEPKTQEDPGSIDLVDWRTSVELNLTAQFITLKAALPWLEASPGRDRSVTLTSSFNALSGQGMPAYSAAKAGLIGMMNALVGPLGSSGIRINVVAPGTIRTPRTERIWAHVPDHFERLGKNAALGRVGTPDDVAAAYRSLALHLSHVTGQVLVVDGGQMGRPG